MQISLFGFSWQANYGLGYTDWQMMVYCFLIQHPGRFEQA